MQWIFKSFKNVQFLLLCGKNLASVMCGVWRRWCGEELSAALCRQQMSCRTLSELLCYLPGKSGRVGTRFMSRWKSWFIRVSYSSGIIVVHLQGNILFYCYFTSTFKLLFCLLFCSHVAHRVVFKKRFLIWKCIMAAVSSSFHNIN